MKDVLLNWNGRCVIQLYTCYELIMFFVGKRETKSQHTEPKTEKITPIGNITRVFVSVFNV